jgi:hypothetical protein
MNFYSISSGDHDPNNDFISMNIAMSADSYSNIKIYNSGTTGVIEYNTDSDYIWKMERVKYVSTGVVQLSSSQSQRIDYPDSLSWVPGNIVCPLSNNENVKVAKLKTFTNKVDLDEFEYLKSGKIILEDYYDEPWSPQGMIQVSNVYSSEGNMPFVDVKEVNVSLTGSINLYSSSIAGSIFSIDIKRNFISGDGNQDGSINLPEEFDPVYTNSNRMGDTVEEWNSIFQINQNCNADSKFRNGVNRDEKFIEEIGGYLNKNWYNKLKRNIWGDYINNQNINLSSRDPEILKNHIFYCFYYFGASDDMNELFKANSDLKNIDCSWHMSTGGKSIFSENVRAITSEVSYLPVIGETKRVSKIFGLPPRTVYAYNLENNINISNFIGSINSDGTTNPNGSNNSSY